MNDIRIKEILDELDREIAKEGAVLLVDHAEGDFECYLTANKNVIPDDNRPAFDPSGLRLGTPAITTRGLKASDMSKLAEWIVRAVKGRDNDQVISELRREVCEFAQRFPLPSDK